MVDLGQVLDTGELQLVDGELGLAGRLFLNDSFSLIDFIKNSACLVASRFLACLVFFADEK